MDFEARVAGLSALAEPARLRIVDLLGIGDASPGELRAELGLPSNLLAHHLKVLEDAGIVSRHRSHADKRRTYLRLHRERLAGLLPAASSAAGATAERVVFVCTANSARSQLAAALWREASPIPVTSGGTHPGAAIAPGAVAAARRHGLVLVQERPQSLDGLLRDGDFVVTVCDAAHEELPADRRSGTRPRLAGVSHWSVPDPVAAGTDAAFDAAYDDIAGRVADLAPRLTPTVDATPDATAS
ncbi:helix-turn-helix domain-containing protein [Nocardioides cavernae]|uniref:Helix-turn-helix domain-containing protein n=1 Tax=Nocardioides cavernae TaxID=1921566 RepID=A0ABR8NDA8_9ACTN|nr:helix-turn-helix domain-containing protein [Nocardioides cavernae]MBD3926120.1 helix-turn-helix domain-containing protein [Nocardioides cavernae]MBM7513710.1 protein-tyrosine-phosphatase [Nocardioides cavernae]